MRRALLAALALLLALGGCTGTQEGEETVLLVVATDSAIGLVHHVQTVESGLEWLPESVDDLSDVDEVVGMHVARYAGPDENDVRVELLYRDGGDDFLRTYDATFVPPDDAGFFEPGDTTNLTALVAASDVLPATEALCTTAFDVSPNGRWLALVHDPASCTGVGEAPALLVIDRDGEEDLEVLEQNVGSPRFGPASDVLYYVDEFLGDVLARPLPTDGATPEVVDLPTALDDPVDLAIGPTGRLSLAGPDAVAVVDPGDDETVDAQESLPGLEAVLDSDLPEDDSVTARTSTQLAVHPDPLVEVEDGEDAYCDASSSGRIVDATVGPFSFAYVLVEERIEVFDLLACDPADPAGSTLRPNPVLSDDLAGAVAIDWIFGAAPDTNAAP